MNEIILSIIISMTLWNGSPFGNEQIMESNMNLLRSFLSWKIVTSNIFILHYTTALQFFKLLKKVLFDSIFRSLLMVDQFQKVMLMIINDIISLIALYLHLIA